MKKDIVDIKEAYSNACIVEYRIELSGMIKKKKLPLCYLCNATGINKNASSLGHLTLEELEKLHKKLSGNEKHEEFKKTLPTHDEYRSFLSIKKIKKDKYNNMRDNFKGLRTGPMVRKIIKVLG